MAASGKRALIAGVAVALALVGYGVVAHRLTIHDDHSAVGYLFAIASLAAMVIALGWTTRWRWVVLLAVLLAAGFGYSARDRIVWDPRWLYLLQHAGVNAMLAWVFGRTMRSGRVALISRLALRAHPDMPPDMVAYTRSVNAAWTLFFVLMTVLSLLLFFLAPTAWSVFANFLTLPAVALMFIGEYALRLRRFPDFEHARLIDGIRLFSRHR